MYTVSQREIIDKLYNAESKAHLGTAVQYYQTGQLSSHRNDAVYCRLDKAIVPDNRSNKT